MYRGNDVFEVKAIAADVLRSTAVLTAAICPFLDEYTQGSCRNRSALSRQTTLPVMRLAVVVVSLGYGYSRESFLQPRGRGSEALLYLLWKGGLHYSLP